MTPSRQILPSRSFVALLALCIVFAATALRASAQRTVILIIGDDWGSDYCGFYDDHGDTATLPTVRSLLTRGVVFQNAMSNSTCSPTRAGVLTGRYSFRTGVGWVVGGDSTQQLKRTEITIPRLLHAFDTTIAKAQFGKWHLHPSRPTSNYLMPNVMGYDAYAGNFSGVLPSYYVWNKISNGVGDTCRTYATTETVNDAVTWMRAQGNRPCFLWLGFNAPHYPLHLPPKGMYHDTTLTGTHDDLNARPRAYYEADLEALDYEIGRMCDSLRAMGRLDSTDFILIGDNGTPDEVAQIADPSRAKGTVYQYGVHVPFIVAGPSVVNPGRVTYALVNTVDIFATVMDMFGFTEWRAQIPPASPVDSRSVMPILKNQVDSIRAWTFTEQFRVIPDHMDAKAIRTRTYKLIRFDSGAEEMYDLERDRDEAVNLLTGVPSDTVIAAYTALCDTLTALVGPGHECKGINAVREAPVDAFTLQAFPNPFSTSLRITSAQPGVTFELVNMLGQVVMEGRGGGEIDVAALPQGVYVLRDAKTHAQGMMIMKR